MCQPKSAGGKRCAAHQPAFLGVKLLLKEKYGLTESQINHAYKSLRAKYKKDTDTVTPEEYDSFIKSQEALLDTVPGAVRKRAETQFGKEAVTNKSLLNATRHLEEYARAQRSYIDGEITKIAKDSNIPPEKVEIEYRIALTEDTPNIPGHNDILDAQTRYALIRAGIKSSNDREPSRRVVLYPNPHSQVVQRMGWSSEDGRLEMELPNGVHAFRNVDAEQWEEIQENPAMFLRGDAKLSHHQYDSPEQAAKDAYRVWCDNCKAYRLLSRNHKCEDEIARAYRNIRSGIEDKEDDTHQPLPTWARVWEKRPQINLEETPDVKDLAKQASQDDIVNFPLTYEGEDGEVVSADMSAGRIAPNQPTLIMNTEPRCTCDEAREGFGQCYHTAQFQRKLEDFHSRFDVDDAANNWACRFPDNGGVYLRVPAGAMDIQQVRDVLSLVRRDRPVRLYVESEDSPVAGSIDLQKEDSAFRASASLFCNQCASASCGHITGIRKTLVDQVERGFYSPRARLQALSQTLAPGSVELSSTRERQSTPYSKDVQTYLEDYRALQRRSINGEDIIPFVEGSVTKGMLASSASEGQGFGVELEFALSEDNDPLGDDQLQAIAQEMADRGLSKTPEHFEYGQGTRTIGYRNGWVVERDESVGGEIVSPVLYDNAEDWKQLREVCDIIKKHGGKVNESAGGHIHIGSPSNDERDTRVVDFIMEHQDALHRMNKNPHHSRHRANGYSAPFTNITAQNALYQMRARYIDPDQRDFACVGAKGGQTTEFRDPDGSLDPGVIQTQVMMYAALVKRAERGELNSRGERHPVGYNYRRRNLLAGTRKKLNDEEVTVSDIPFRHAIDELFDDPEDRQRLVALGVLNEWQPE